MAHRAQLDYIQSVKAIFPNLFSSAKVLEVGSLDINGSVRQFFTDCNYTGIDVGAGKGVDIVVNGEEYNAPDNSFDVTISCECFEHNPKWVETFHNMIRMTIPNGLVIMTCAAPGRPEHGTRRSEPTSSPLTVNLGWEYYRNLNENDFRASFAIEELFSQFKFIENTATFDLYFWGIKK